MGKPAARISRKEHLWSDPASRAVIRVVLWYALFGVIWILASDHAARLLFPSPESFERASVIKGWLYVVVTAIGLFGLLLAAMHNLRRSNSEAAAYFHTTPAVMQVCDTDLKLAAVNEAGLRLYGRSLEHLQESDWIAQVVTADDQQALRSFMRSALNPEVPAGSADTAMIHVMASSASTRTLLCRV